MLMFSSGLAHAVSAGVESAISANQRLSADCKRSVRVPVVEKRGALMPPMFTCPQGSNAHMLRPQSTAAVGPLTFRQLSSSPSPAWVKSGTSSLRTLHGLMRRLLLAAPDTTSAARLR